jgi:hypothetical protein
MVGVYGIYDLPDWWRVTQPPTRTDDPVRQLMGKSYAEAKADYENFSPLHRVQALQARPGASYLIIHGDEDAIVHHNQSERFIAALREHEAGVEDMLIPDASMRSPMSRWRRCCCDFCSGLYFGEVRSE